MSVAYLTSNTSAGSCTITNSSGTPATLTVVQKTGTNTYAGQINGLISLVFSGTGNQTLTGNNSYSGGTTINAGTVTAASTAALGSGPITVNGGGLIFQSTGLSTVFALLQSGYNGGTWNGSTGINSTAAAGDTSHLHAVGMLQPASATTFEGQPLGTGDVAVKYTYYGDANLDGKVDGSDYTLIDNGYMNGLTGWQNGDFNYDGVVDGSDYTLMDNAFNTQGAQLSAQIAAPNAIATAQIAGSFPAAAVPEPTTLALLAGGSLCILSRRRSSR